MKHLRIKLRNINLIFVNIIHNYCMVKLEDWNKVYPFSIGLIIANKILQIILGMQNKGNALA